MDTTFAVLTETKKAVSTLKKIGRPKLAKALTKVSAQEPELHVKLGKIGDKLREVVSDMDSLNRWLHSEKKGGRLLKDLVKIAETLDKQRRHLDAIANLAKKHKEQYGF